MSTIKSDNSDLTINASGSTSDIKFQANGVEKVVIDSSGNVGIGVTPESDWHSSQWDALQMGLGGAVSSYATGAGVSSAQLSSNMYATLGSSLSGYKYINDEAATSYYQYSGIHYFRVAPSGTADAAISWTTAMTIENDGRITQDFNGSVHDGFKSNDSYTGAGSTKPFVFIKNGSEVGSISTLASSTSFNTSSDYRLKENVVPMTGSIDRLKALNPSRFNFIADADTTVDGFLAHEAQVIVPECVTGEKDAMMTEEYEVTPAVMDGEKVVTEAVMGEREVPDMQGIDQSKLVPLLVASLQEAVARIEVLEAQLNA